VFVFLASAQFAWSLEPDQIALIVNRNVPEGAELARHYAQVRGVPNDRIIQLDLPPADQIPYEDYERALAVPVRDFLRANGLEQQVHCLVTFYGVPLRVSARVTTPQETEELARLRTELQRVQTELGAATRRLEILAARVSPGFQPLAVPTADVLARRADHATRALMAAIEQADEPQQREQLRAQAEELSRPLQSPIGDPPATRPATSPAAGPATEPAQLQPQVIDPNELGALLQRPDDPEARERVRAIARRSANPFAYEKVLQEHSVYLTSEHTDSAIDSDLSLIWAGPYPRAGWQPNPLGYPFINNPSKPRVVMVMRLDAPTPEGVREMIQTSLAVEAAGLRGKVVIDSRGIPPRQASGATDSFGVFDQRLRELAGLVEARSGLELVHDEKPDVLPPDSAADVAIYCGWYSVGKYVPSMKFAPGAVGYHIASYELTSLRDPANTGWGRGLISDGVVATLGPVAEPLLHAFPGPDDFFPLLMTGRLTLAEVYWRTSPLTSWKMTAIGDPLYRPFAQNPQIRVEDLPPRLRVLFPDVPVEPSPR
jgi:uncharacterized protein (TIGR03790 family)